MIMNLVNSLVIVKKKRFLETQLIMKNGPQRPESNITKKPEQPSMSNLFKYFIFTICIVVGVCIVIIGCKQCYYYLRRMQLSEPAHLKSLKDDIPDTEDTKTKLGNELPKKKFGCC